MSEYWDVDHTILKVEDNLMSNPAAEAMPYVVSGMILFFLMAGILSLRFRLRN